MRQQHRGLAESERADRAAGPVLLFENLLQDIRFGLRTLSRRPTFSIIIILVLGLGIGANSAMFSIVNAVLLKPLPYKDSDRLVVIWQSTPEHRETGEWFNTFSEFEEWQRSSRSLERVGALSWAVAPRSLMWHGRARRIMAIPASVDLFSLLGVQAAAGRTFLPSDLGQGCTVVLGHAFWQNVLGAPAGLPGQNLVIDQAECRVAGIMPKDFSFYPRQTDLWTLITPSSEYMKDPWRSVTGVFARLKPAVSRAAAESELEMLERDIIPQAPADLALARQAVPVVLDMKSEFTWLTGRNLRSALIVLFGTVFAVLLIACVNVANLVLAQAGERQKELAIRASLGSGRGRLIRQLLVESLLLSFGGALAGTLLALAAVQLFRTHSPVQLPPGNPLTLDWQVLVFTATLAVLCAILFGLVPAWKASRLDLNEALKEASQSLAAGRAARRARSFLVAGEVALSLVLLAGAGLLIESLARLASTPLGFRTDHLLTAMVSLPEKRYSEPEHQVQFFDRLREQVASIPGAEGVALASGVYLRGSNVLAIEGRPFARDTAAYDVGEEAIDQNFLDVMGIPLLEGRMFDTRDRNNTLPVAIVNQALAGQYFRDEDPIGRHIKLGPPESPESKNPWLTVVGVVGNVKTTTVFQEMGYVVPPAVYRPLRQQPSASMALLVRTRGNPDALADALQQKVQGLDDEVTLAEIKSMEESLSELQAEPRFRTILLTAFAVLALVLAALGLYGLLMQSVIRRTREIGICMALGASRGNVIQAILKQALITCLAGIGIGLMGSFFLARFLSGLLYQIRPENPAILGGVSVLLLAVALAASYLPARRATTIDPLKALRSE